MNTYTLNPNNTKIEDFNARWIPDINSSIPGINFKNLNDLNIRKILNTSIKLKPVKFKPKTNISNVGIDKTINIKSNMFQPEEKKPLKR